MTKWPVQKQTHRTTQKHIQHQGANSEDKNNIFVFQFLNFYYIFNYILLIIFSPKNITLNWRTERLFFQAPIQEI